MIIKGVKDCLLTITIIKLPFLFTSVINSEQLELFAPTGASVLLYANKATWIPRNMYTTPQTHKPVLTYITLIFIITLQVVIPIYNLVLHKQFLLMHGLFTLLLNAVLWQHKVLCHNTQYFHNDEYEK